MTAAFTAEVLEELRRHEPLVQVEDLNLEEIFCAMVEEPKAAPAGESAS